MNVKKTRKNAPAPVRFVKAKRDGGTIVADAPDASIAADIDAGRVVILRGAFEPMALLELRKEVVEWGRATPVFPNGVSAGQPFLNFHRIDDGNQPSRLPHLFHIYGFGDIEALPARLAGRLRGLAQSLLDLQNRLADTAFTLASGEYKTSVQRYPRGGSHLVGHVHPYLPQRVILFLNLSEPGTDYSSGGTKWFVGGKWVDTFSDYRIGDVLCWRLDLKHCVDPIDKDANIDWNAVDGFWVLSNEAIAMHGQSVVSEPKKTA